MAKWWWLVCMWCSLGGAMAQSLPNLHGRVVRVQETVRFVSSSQMQISSLTEREALTEQGAQQMTKHTFGFNGALEQVELIEAYTLKKSGQKIMLAAEGLTKQKGHVASGTGITVPDWEVHQIAFPSLAIGDRTVIHTRRTVHKPALDGWLSYNDYLWPSMEISQATWRIEAPLDLQVHVKSTIANVQPVVQGDWRVWELSGSTQARAIDSNPSSARVTAPYIVASTLPEHEAVATRFAQQVQAKIQRTDELKSLVAQITQGKRSDEAKTRAVYDWIRKNLKYTAIFMANGGWEPHDTSHILATRYGDCKDHVTLMVAMLQLVGIAAEPVLVNTASEFVLDPLPVASSYNHTIVYVPSLRKYLDPTAGELPYEAQHWSLASRPVARSDGTRAQLDRIPVIAPEHNSSVAHTTVTIAADGSARLQIEHRLKGMAAAAAHERLASYRSEFEAAQVQRALSGAGFYGSGRFSHSPVNRDVLEQTLRWDVRVRNFMADPAAGSISVHPSLGVQTHILSYTGNYSQEQREFPVQCSAYHVKESFHVSFDPRFDILRVPKDMQLEQVGVRFSSRVSKQDSQIKGEREIRFAHTSQECSPEEYQRRRELITQITRHLRSPVLFVQADDAPAPGASRVAGQVVANPATQASPTD